MPSNDPWIAAMWAQHECLRLIASYGRAVDMRDADALGAVFWADAQVDLGFFKGAAGDAVAFLLQNAARSDRRLHATFSTSLTIDGEHATGDSCCLTHALNQGPDGAVTWHIFLGRYLDRFEARAGEWRLTARRFVLNGHFSGEGAEPEFLRSIVRAGGLS